MSGPLAGIRVLDLTRYIPGPYCTLILADLGADVVKLEEPPVGDPTRLVPPAVGGQSAVHACLNRGKRSVVADLRSDEGAARARRLALKADVLVESYRPGVLARRGLGADALRAENPRLVYCSITGYGQEGPLAARAGHDVNYAALAGFLTGPLPPAQVADMLGGIVAALGVLAALLARERSGEGAVVDASLFASMLALMTVPAARLLAGGGVVNELTGTHACYNVYACRDGRRLSVGALEPKFWEALCRALGHPEKVGRQWERGEAARATVELFARAFAARDREDWLRELTPLDACVEPVLGLDEALAQPPAQAALVEQALGAATLRTLVTPVRLSGATPALRPAPGLGEHEGEVLAETGWGA